ncbi:uncharacterized protein [Diadema setosum]|uniref:uncharacterized protein n=1 Tax=Diadema setosum TaxID=31175 RepID=UPI003B3A3468
MAAFLITTQGPRHPVIGDFVEEEQQLAEEEEEEEDEPDKEDTSDDDDEGIEAESQDQGFDPIDEISVKHARLVKSDVVTDQANPAVEDVLMGPKHLHLPGFEEVEQLALLLVKLADNTDQHLIPTELCLQISNAVAALHDHDKSARSFIKKYESKWGYTLFGRCLGQESPEKSAAQKTKFSWMKYAQAARITDESRLLYVVIKMLKNRPAVSTLSSPTKIAQKIKGQYKRIVDRVRDNRVLADARIPLPNINVKSISTFLNKEDKRANYLATVVPKAPGHRRLISTKPLPDAPTLPSSLPPPNREQVQYSTVPLDYGERRPHKRKLELDAAEERPTTSVALPTLLPRPPKQCTVPKAPVLVVVPYQPSAASVSFPSTSSATFTVNSPPPPPPKPKAIMPNRSRKPCAACGKPNCGGQRKRYMPSKEKLRDSSQKMFTFCPHTCKSLTPGFLDRVYDSYEHFKETVDSELAKN